ncbi:MAG: glucosaminidase domain-containing protein [Bacteroidaceae bacterium]|nr:glucosaminidase domain-containing protein [Bacteroidaceae bacterium]
MIKKLLLTWWLCLVVGTVSAQQSAYQAYIEQYKHLAIQQMQRYRIPASITLAQALLESNAGRSNLTQRSNNHFGIKVGMNWTGPYVLANDDAPDEKFRKYGSARESYEDRSRFLSARGRYSSLFNLAPTDYKGWAYGLKAAGYATNPRYGDILVELIERYNLHHYDRPQRGGKYGNDDVFAPNRQFYLCNDRVYVFAQPGDTYERIARDLDMRASHLRYCNEVDETYQLRAGDIVYLKRKQKHVVKELRQTFHKVQPGESMYSISQLYCIRLERLYRYNYFAPDYQAKVGDLIYLR